MSGTVTKGGTPLGNAWIEFVPEAGRLSAAQTDEEGRYTLAYTRDAEGAIVGKHTVKIGTGGGQAASHSAAARNAAGQAPQQLFEKSNIMVEEGDNMLDFEITEGNEYKAPAGRGRR